MKTSTKDIFKSLELGGIGAITGAGGSFGYQTVSKIFVNQEKEIQELKK
ncbi:hypothetical protein [Candidatus Mycoplasma haematohominis]|nr:hypothetical protein [Candidatus Mycoplasma haemohominis]